MLTLTVKAPKVQGQAARRETLSGKLHIGGLLRGEGGFACCGEQIEWQCDSDG